MDDKIRRSLIVDIPFEAIGRELKQEVEVSDEERCTYADHRQVRCTAKRWSEFYPHCHLHHVWEMTTMSLHGAPMPVDRESMHMFLMVMIGMVQNARVPRDKANAIVRLCELIMKNMRGR